MILDRLLEKIDLTGCSFPFIDLENEKIISNKRIKQYIKRG